LATEIIDKGWANVIRETKLAAKSFTKVGLPENSTPVAGNKKGSGHKQTNEMSKLVKIGAAHEFGAPKKGIPERPFIRPSYDKNKEALQNIIENEYTKIITGKVTVRLSLGRIGEWMKAKTQKQIRDLTSPPLSEKTIARKKSTKLLIDTGQLIQSITHIEGFET
jgi:phage gpG-like protein